MTASDCDFWVASDSESDTGESEEVVELALLLHRDQFFALERLAGARGISVGRLLRQMIRDYLTRELGATEALPVADLREKPLGSQSGNGPGDRTRHCSPMRVARGEEAMSQTGVAAFDSTVQATNMWLKDLSEALGWSDRHKVYHALRAVLQILRDHLTIDEVVTLGAQLPLLVRGVYYEGWHPAGKPLKDRHKAGFLARVAEQFRNDQEADPELVCRAVFAVLERHVTAGEVEGIKKALPHEIRALWR